ncbi:MAG: helix-turn-helix domain-containing protein [bacterium]|nr:helix-turn-helix domain-containing protein [bacterium]
MKRHQLHSLANILGAVHDLGEDQLQFVLHLVHLVKTSMPTREHSVTALALRLGLGEQTFRRRVHRATGKSPKQLILAIQMHEASRLLLEDPHIMIRDVALSCGFEETSFFSHAFKKWSGMSPMHFRENRQSCRFYNEVINDKSVIVDYKFEKISDDIAKI